MEAIASHHPAQKRAAHGPHGRIRHPASGGPSPPRDPPAVGPNQMSKALRGGARSVRHSALRAGCERADHALAQVQHDADRWIAATAVHVRIPLVSHDRVLLALRAGIRDCTLNLSHASFRLVHGPSRSGISAMSVPGRDCSASTIALARVSRSSKWLARARSRVCEVPRSAEECAPAPPPWPAPAL